MKICVLAGNLKEANNFIQRNYEKYIYCPTIESLQGYKFEDVFVVGTFWERENAGELYTQARHKMIKLTENVGGIEAPIASNEN